MRLYILFDFAGPCWKKGVSVTQVHGVEKMSCGWIISLQKKFWGESKWPADGLSAALKAATKPNYKIESLAIPCLQKGII
jgi:hypothetical protein